jgi:hypothetical protein
VGCTDHFLHSKRDQSGGVHHLHMNLILEPLGTQFHAQQAATGITKTSRPIICFRAGEMPGLVSPAEEELDDDSGVAIFDYPK